MSRKFYNLLTLFLTDVPYCGATWNYGYCPGTGFASNHYQAIEDLRIDNQQQANFKALGFLELIALTV